MLVRYIRFMLTSLSRSSHASQERMITDANAHAHAHAHISVAKLAYERNPIYGRHPSNPGDDQGGTCRTLVWRRIEEDEMALVSLEGGGKVGSSGTVDWHVEAGANGCALPTGMISP